MTSSPLLEIDHITVTVFSLAVTLTLERGLASEVIHIIVYHTTLIAAPTTLYIELS